MTDSVKARRESNWLGTFAMSIADAQRSAAEEAAGQAGAAPAALVALTEFGGGPVTSFASMLGVTESGAVRLFERLARAGLVERTPGRDARTLAVRLTPNGRRTARRVIQARQRQIEQILAPLQPAERKQLAELSRKLLASLATDRVSVRRTCRLCDYEVCHRAGVCPVQAPAY